jgi:hypothetical protein
MSRRLPDKGFNDTMWTPFYNWVEAHYPDDLGTMYIDGRLDRDFAKTEESVVFWERRTREYVDVVRAVNTATAFVEAYATFDVDQAASYLASDADLWLGDLEELQLENRLLQAQGFRLLLDSCEHRTTTSDGIVVGCSWDFHAIRSDEMGLGPFTGSRFDLTVREEEIVAASMNWAYIDEFSPQVWGPFSQWVTDTYPEDVDVMYLPAYANYRLTEESIALWEQRSREYADAVLAGQ